ncbi:hypothetical protein COLO4_37428 [Corchorus olitorius]|uniref:Terpene synthase metal-binding domain-containing protein n=1 Tax=Corchorus olitorius TaxID=93759 RepID=A0A1R3G1X5_9ROSI|nr:hypothetical protein COLO4_37428 [Corchorus olitorius]
MTRTTVWEIFKLEHRRCKIGACCIRNWSRRSLHQRLRRSLLQPSPTHTDSGICRATGNHDGTWRLPRASRHLRKLGSMPALLLKEPCKSALVFKDPSRRPHRYAGVTDKLFSGMMISLMVTLEIKDRETWRESLQLYHWSRYKAKIFAGDQNALQGDPRLKAISEAIRVVPHFPKPGIMFQDITTLLLDHKAFKDTVDIFVDRYRDMAISVVADLPECMKICFKALYDITNEIAYDIQEHNGWINVHYFTLEKLGRAGFCKALFVEAKWYNEGYTPSLEEYLSNALISSGGIVISVRSMLSVGHDQISEEMLNFLGQNEDLLYNVSIIIRLCNDLGTSVAEKERGDAPSSSLCYMREVNVSEEQAQEHIKDLITKTWKKINGQSFNISQSPALQSFVE